MKKKKTAKKVSTKKASTKKKPVKKSTSKKVSSARVTAETAISKKTAKKTAPKAAPKKTSSIPRVSLAIGSVAPGITLPDETGKVRSFDDFRGKKLVIYFYPKDDTPGCTKESCDFRDSFSRLAGKGVAVVGISKDSVSSHVKFKNKYSLNFSLLSDEKSTVCESYGVWKEKSMYGRTYMGIERSTFVVDVDSQGIAKVLFVYPKVSVPGHVDQILSDLGIA